ncbi:MAG: hypothetical protein JW738_05190 [Actinobacteria bacterium]|nr:hypothetical protein [Actinomycetota bacterium]
MDYDNLEVQADRIAVEGIIFDTVTLKSDSWPDASYEAWVTDKEMYGVFSVSTSYLSQPALKLEGGYLIASGTINVGYSAVTVNIRGSLVPRDGRRIFLLPAEVEVTSPYNSSAIEDEVIDTVNSKPLFDMQENLPFKVSEIHITTGRLRFNGSMNIEHALKQM